MLPYADTFFPALRCMRFNLDETLQDQILEWREPFDAFSREVVGQTTTDLDQTPCLLQVCTLGNAVTDSMVYARTSIGATVDFGLQ